jgi:hypothetical protein
MRHILWLVCVLAAGLYSCDKLPKNDDLDGMWHLQRITHLNATPQVEEDVAPSRIYWSVQLDLLQINSPQQLMYRDEVTGKQTYNAYCRFNYTGTTLNINKIYLSFDVKDSLLLDPTTQIMEPYGITGCADNFNIESLGSKQMILVSDTKRLVFRRF